MRSFLASLLPLLPVASYDADVVIVGAGTSGLVAAKSLIESKPDLKIHVLEQRDHAGGRTVNLDVPGYPGTFMEGGGTWIGPTQYQALNLTKELGLELYHTYYNYPGADPETKTPQLFPVPRAETYALIDELENLAKEVGTEAPWEHERAEEYDSISFADWLKEKGASEGAINDFSMEVTGALGCDNWNDMSLLFYLFFTASCPYRYDTGNYGGAQDLRLVRGSQAISLELLKVVRQAGVQVHFGTSVKHVDVSDGGVTLTTEQGEVQGRRVIIALGTGDAARLQYTGLTPEREHLHAKWINNPGIKFFFVFEEAFWRKGGLLGKPKFPQAGDGGGLFYDYTPFNKTSPGIIAGFWNNDTHDSGPAGHRAILEGLLVAALGPRVLGNVEGYVEKYWDLAHDGGTANIVQYMPKGVLSKVGKAWRAPIERLHWAGSDTAQKWMGYIDGAIESGKRTASEVLAGLSQETGLRFV